MPRIIYAQINYGRIRFQSQLFNFNYVRIKILPKKPPSHWLDWAACFESGEALVQGWTDAIWSNIWWLSFCLLMILSLSLSIFRGIKYWISQCEPIKINNNHILYPPFVRSNNYRTRFILIEKSFAKSIHQVRCIQKNSAKMTATSDKIV